MSSIIMEVKPQRSIYAIRVFRYLLKYDNRIFGAVLFPIAASSWARFINITHDLWWYIYNGIYFTPLLSLAVILLSAIYTTAMAIILACQGKSQGAIRHVLAEFSRGSWRFRCLHFRNTGTWTDQAAWRYVPVPGSRHRRGNNSFVASLFAALLFCNPSSAQPQPEWSLRDSASSHVCRKHSVFVRPGSSLRYLAGIAVVDCHLASANRPGTFRRAASSLHLSGLQGLHVERGFLFSPSWLFQDTVKPRFFWRQVRASALVTLSVPQLPWQSRFPPIPSGLYRLTRLLFACAWLHTSKPGVITIHFSRYRQVPSSPPSSRGAARRGAVAIQGIADFALDCGRAALAAAMTAIGSRGTFPRVAAS